MKSLLLVIVGCSILEISDAGTFCSKEHDTCECVGKVKFGIDDNWTEEKDVDGSIGCAANNFGNVDPAPGVKKECRCTPKCSENWTWESEKEANWKRGWICNDYSSIMNQWCENGGIGSGWNSDWSWTQDANGLDARDVCCACGGKGLVQPQGTNHYYYVGSAGGVCRYASDVITTQEECTSALSWISSGEYWTGRYDGAPAGCSGEIKSGGDIKPVFNKINGVGKGRGDLFPICKKDTSICKTAECDQCFRNNNCIAYGKYSEMNRLTCTVLGGIDCTGQWEEEYVPVTPEFTDNTCVFWC